jgi:hypothetical protein
LRAAYGSSLPSESRNPGKNDGPGFAVPGSQSCRAALGRSSHPAHSDAGAERRRGSAFCFVNGDRALPHMSSAASRHSPNFTCNSPSSMCWYVPNYLSYSIASERSTQLRKHSLLKDRDWEERWECLSVDVASRQPVFLPPCSIVFVRPVALLYGALLGRLRLNLEA